MPLFRADRELLLSQGDVIKLAAPDGTGADALDTTLAKLYPDGLASHGRNYLWTGTVDLMRLFEPGPPVTQDEIERRSVADLELVVELVRRDIARPRRRDTKACSPVTPWTTLKHSSPDTDPARGTWSRLMSTPPRRFGPMRPG